MPDKKISQLTERLVTAATDVFPVVYVGALQTEKVQASTIYTYIKNTLVSGIIQATTDTDKFLVQDGTEIKYRTGSELLNDILPTQTGNSGKYLTTDGTTPSWAVVTAGISGSGTTNYVPKFTSATAIGNSQIFDSGSLVGIGTASPYTKLTVDGLVGTNGVSGSTGYIIRVSNTEITRIYATAARTVLTSTQAIWMGINYGLHLTIFPSGNVGVKISDDVDSGHAFQVLGSVNFRTITNATIDTDRFLVSDSGVIKYRTGTQLLSDIGGISGGFSAGYIPYATGSNTLANGPLRRDVIGTITILSSVFSADRGLKIRYDSSNNELQSWLGDFGTSGNGTYLLVTDSPLGTSIIETVYASLSIGMYLDFQNSLFYFGDYNAVGNGTNICINETANQITLTTAELYAFMASGSTANILYYDSSTGRVTYGPAGGGGGGVTGSGFVNQLPKWTGTTTLGNSLISDDGISIGYGSLPITAYAHNFASVGKIVNFETGTNGRIRIASTAAANTDGFILTPFSNFIFGSNIYYNQPNWVYDKNGYGVYVQMETQVNGTFSVLTAPLNSSGSGALATPQIRMTVFNDGVVTINKNVASTYRLDIGASTNGLRITGAGTTSATIGFRVESSTAVTNFQVLDNGNVGIREPNPSARLHLIHSGGTTASIGLKVRNSADTLDILKTYGNTQVQIASTASALEASAQLQIDSTTRGLLIPRMTNAEVLAIAAPANGLLVYNTTINHLVAYQGGTWVKFSHSPM